MPSQNAETWSVKCNRPGKVGQVVEKTLVVLSDRVKANAADDDDDKFNSIASRQTNPSQNHVYHMCFTDTINRQQKTLFDTTVHPYRL